MHSKTYKTFSIKIKQMKIKLTLIALLISVISTANVLIETEQFTNRGGWVMDHQAFPKIESAYMLAHGYGRPVKDATTTIDFKEAGEYHVYVSTYNWTSPWYNGKGAGAFQVKVNGKALPTKLGITGNKWEWQYAGKVSIKGKTNIALHDLTGFEGRADAIYFTKKKQAPPSKKDELNEFRLKALGYDKATECGKYDLVVVGGGVAGCCTALSAARYGLKVALIDNLPGLGGNHYLAVRLCGVINKNLYPNLGNMLRQLTDLPIPKTPEEFAAEPHKQHFSGAGHLLNVKNPKDLAKIRKQLLLDAGVTVHQLTHVYKLEKDGENKISAVTGKHLKTGEELRFEGELFADCTGDGIVGMLAGADHRIGREARSETKESLAPEVADQKKMGLTLWWNSKDVKKKTSFPTLSELPWAAQVNKEYHFDVTKGGWFWESGLELNVAEDMELARDNLMRAIYGNWAFIKNEYSEKYANYDISLIGYIGMKRESNRLMGDVILNQNDIDDRVEFPDASFTTTWSFDLHYATPDNTKHFKGWEWITETHHDKLKAWVKPSYHVPYRVLYSRNIDNLFIGGRAMSVTHVALGTVRVMATLGMAGEVTGMAAALCIKNNETPRGIYKNHLDDLKSCMKSGAPLK